MGVLTSGAELGDGLAGAHERGQPAGTEGAAGVLPRLGDLAVVGQHRVDAALQLAVAPPDGVTHPRVVPRYPYRLELLVQVGHEDRDVRAASDPGGARVQPHDEERGPGGTEREVVITAVRGDVRAPCRLVGVGDRLQLGPQTGEALSCDLGSQHLDQADIRGVPASSNVTPISS